MNLRILKKLSKRAAPLLSRLGDHRQQFPAEKEESFQHLCGHDRKHWERTRAKYPLECRGEIKYRPRDCRDWIVMREPYHPLKGTPMVGSMVGDYEREWEEQTAWEALRHIVFNHFSTWNENGRVLLRDLSTPSQVLRAAHEVAATLSA
ncbi:hypothetical protein [Burkholderia gladioli]|uniref:hypothetical protein n=1 Tax=Burkholderia gladioli TaxID=28095 RepID=UPI00163E555C|nr:hypothetical protein [Burkholderia gladioli]